jgi:membrane protein YdbS with pleckstrin-like domain
LAFFFYGLFVVFVGGIGTLVSLDDPSSLVWLVTWWLPLNIGMWIFNLVWLIPAWVLTPFYVGSIEYSVIAESGETMPEVYVRKGIIRITRKHVPFRTITNISTMAGPFDRLFGIGNVNIETAGYSGKQSGPEEKLEGFEFYEELRDFILKELRMFRSPYVTGTEVVSRHEEPVPHLPDTLDDEILVTLREMREVLLEIARALKTIKKLRPEHEEA